MWKNRLEMEEMTLSEIKVATKLLKTALKYISEVSRVNNLCAYTIYSIYLRRWHQTKLLVKLLFPIRE